MSSPEHRRLLIHSHNSYGLGHIRRSQLIAQHLVENIPELSVLILTGTSNLHLIKPKQGIDYIKLPCLTALYQNGSRLGYGSPYLETTFERIYETRKQITLAAVQAFDPHVFLSDIGPGIEGEAVATLEWIKQNRPQTHTVVELTDILGPTDTIKRKWAQRRSHETFSLYDSLLVYGEPEFFCYDEIYDGYSGLTEKTVYCGYLRPPAMEQPRNVREELGFESGDRVVLCILGAGISSVKVLNFFLHLAARLPSYKFVATLGPMMSAEERSGVMDQYQGSDNMILLPHFEVNHIQSLLAAADVIITRGGYNSICEAIGYGKTVIAVPIGSVDEEEAVRAEKMAEIGLVTMLMEEELSVETVLPIIEKEYTPPSHPLALKILSNSAYSNIVPLFTSYLSTRESIHGD